MNNQQLGKEGEQAATRYLKKQGYKIVANNYRCKFGEIDIIARDGKELVFVEVKTRSGLGYGSPAAAVDKRKQQQIIKASQNYLAEHDLFEGAARFDVVGVLYNKKALVQIDHFENAFEL